MTRAAKLLTEALTSYQTDGTMYKPGMDTAKKLDAGIYAIKSSMQGIFFEKKTLVQDSVMKFRDPRLVEILKEADKFWELEKNFKELGLIHKRGMLLYGPPGVGKSVLMSQVAEDAIKKDAVVFYAGEPHLASAALKEFREVEPTRNAVCIFDDIDSVLYQEKALLGLLDGENKINHVLFIATTNYLERFPARLLRSGRFDSKTEVLTPPEEGRRAFFKAKVKGIDEQTLSSAVQATEGFSFAQMREVLASVFAYGRDLNKEVDRIRKGDPVQTSGTAGRPSLYQTGEVAMAINNGLYEAVEVTETRASRLLELSGGQKMAAQVQKRSKVKKTKAELAALAKKFDSQVKK